jgi:hypothetical protein
MDKKLVIKIFKTRVKSKDKKSRVIVLTYNSSKVNGGFRFDKIGIIKHHHNMNICYINFYKLGYWLNRGVTLKTKVSWLVGLIGLYELKLK